MESRGLVLESYVVALPRSSGRLFCVDHLRDEWSGRLCYATRFDALHEAVEVAERHGAQVVPLREALMLDAAA